MGASGAPAMASRPRRPDSTAAVGIFLLAAVAFGLAASFLAGPTHPFQASAPASAPFAGYLYFEAVALTILGGLIAWAVYRFANTLRRGTLPVPVHTMIMFLVMFGVAILFIALFHLVGGTAQSVAAANTTVQNNTPPPTPPNSGGGVGNFTGGAGVSLPGWVVYAGLGLAAVVVALFIVPAAVAARRPLPGGSEPRRPSHQEVRAAVTQALADLDAPSSISGNRRIIAAYAALLERFEERRPSGVDGRIETMTPRDVERVCVERLQVARTTASELTVLFEEARYSRHEMGEGDVERARSALRRALSDLDRPVRLG